MTAPAILSAQYQGTTLRVIFDRTIQATPGQELDGFTLTRTPGGVEVPVFVSITSTALVATLPSAILPGEVLDVSYNDVLGTISDLATADPAPSFSIDAVEYPVTPTVVRAIVGELGNDVVSIYFSEPVVSLTGDLLLGLSLVVDGLPYSILTATASLNTDQTVLSITTGSNFAYNQAVDVVYDSGTGNLYTYTAGLVASFTFTDIDNLSTDGLPDSQYPLSFVTAHEIQVVDNRAIGRLGLSLNPVDIQLVAKYGPVFVMTGGTFGVSIANPAGVSVLGKNVKLVDGTEITQDFVSGNAAWSVAAAVDWETVITARIATALGAIRATDQSVTFNTTTIVGV